MRLICSEHCAPGSCLLRGSLPPRWPSRAPFVAASIRDPDTGSLPAASITSSCFCLALRGSVGPSPRPLLGFSSSLPSLPSPPLPRSPAAAAAGHGGFAATRLGSQTLGGGRWGRETEGRSGSGSGEATDRRDLEAAGGREGWSRRLILKRNPKPGDIGPCGSPAAPGILLSREGPRCEIPCELSGRSRGSTTSLGTVAYLSSPGSSHPAGSGG